MKVRQKSILLKRLSMFQPQIAMKKSSACSSRRHKSSNCLPFFSNGSSSLLISSMSVSANLSKSCSFSRTASIMLLFIVFSAKLEISAQSSKNICISQDFPGIVKEIVLYGQVITDNNNTSDNLLTNDNLSTGDKTFFVANTTCKDRWRQVLNEANRIPNKHLFTLQPGVTKNQLQEMKDEHLTLVVPKDNKKFFHPEFHADIMCLSDFIAMVRERQS